MKPKEAKIDELIHDNLNANKHSEYGMRLLEKSISELGLGRSIVVDKNNRIIGGNGVVETAVSLGFEDIIIVPTDGKKLVVVKREDVDLDSEKGRSLALADNAVAKANITWDEKAINEIKEKWDVEPEDWGIEMSEFEEEKEVEDDDFEVPDENTIQTDIVIGDLFEIGEHRLLCGDSTKKDTFYRLFNGQLADAVITDPPYNVNYEGKTKDALTIKNDSMSDTAFYQFLYDFYTAMGTYTKKGGAWYVWHADSEGANFRLAMKQAGVMVKQCLIWVKNSMVMGRQDYQWKHEPCLYGWKEGASHSWYSDRCQTTVLNFDRPTRNAEYPTMKPVPLIAYQIKNSTKQGDIIADGFGGSGTTMVASHTLGRKCYMVEFDPKYCQVIIDRMRKLDPDLIIKKNSEII